VIYLCAGPAAIATRNDWLPILQRAIDDADGRWSADQLLADVEAGKVLVWIVTRDEKIVGVFTVRVIESRVTWVLVEDLAGDDLASWILEAHRALETWAREMGATQIVIEGRKGWERVLRPYGYESTRIQAVKRLEVLQ
jgi:hypothetical protein